MARRRTAEPTSVTGLPVPPVELLHWDHPVWATDRTATAWCRRNLPTAVVRVINRTDAAGRHTAAVNAWAIVVGLTTEQWPLLPDRDMLAAVGIVRAAARDRLAQVALMPH